MEQLCVKLEIEVRSLQKSVLAELGILAVIISGSTVYNSAQNVTQNLTRDIDEAILLSNAEDIHNILDHHRSRLRLILRISLEECSETVLLSSRSSAWNDINVAEFQIRRRPSQDTLQAHYSRAASIHIVIVV